MITVISRLYADSRSAMGAAEELRRKRFPKTSVDVIDAGAVSVEKSLARALVHESAQAAYAERIAGGAAALVVRADYRPLGAKRIARETLADTETLDAGGVTEEYVTKAPRDHAPSILKDHPRFVTLPLDEGELRSGTISEQLGIPLLTRHRTSRSAMPGGRHMTPGPHISERKPAGAILKGGRHMSTGFWRMPLVIERRKTRSVVKGRWLPLSDALGWPTIIHRD